MNKAILGILSLCLVAVAAFGAFAMPGLGRSDDVMDSLQAGDYDAWRSAVEAQHQQRMSEMTEERFNEMVEHHAAMAEKRAERDASRQALHDAIETEDYGAYVAAVGDRPMAQLVTEDNFATFVAMHKARVSGDLDTAKMLADELGFDERMPGPGMRGGHDRGMFHAE